MISGPPISDTSRCDIGNPTITSDIDSDIGADFDSTRYRSIPILGILVPYIGYAPISGIPDIGYAPISDNIVRRRTARGA